jgi:hypothetical protein
LICSGTYVALVFFHPTKFAANPFTRRRYAHERQHLSEGAVTQNYEGKVEDTIALLNQAVATEIVCILRHKFHASIEEVSKGEMKRREKPKRYIGKGVVTIVDAQERHTRRINRNTTGIL